MKTLDTLLLTSEQLCFPANGWLWENHFRSVVIESYLDFHCDKLTEVFVDEHWCSWINFCLPLQMLIEVSDISECFLPQTQGWNHPTATTCYDSPEHIGLATWWMVFFCFFRGKKVLSHAHAGPGYSECIWIEEVWWPIDTFRLKFQRCALVTACVFCRRLLDRREEKECLFLYYNLDKEVGNGLSIWCLSYTELKEVQLTLFNKIFEREMQ